MTTGHILPGYGDPVTRLRRVRSVGYHLDNSILKELESNALLSKREFSQIRENARQLWSRQSLQATTYNTYFSDGEIREVTRIRPSSSLRRNNPHPPQLFITNKLHFIEGYHKPGTTTGKGAYKVDASLSPVGQKQRQAFRDKYTSNPDSAMTKQYKDPYGFKTFLPPTDAHAAEAWVKLADDKDQNRIMDILKERADAAQLQNKDDEIRPKTAYPSLNRWMRLCGAEEQETISRAMQPPYSKFLKNYESYDNQPQLSGDNSYNKSWARNFGYCSQLRRGEYSIHPGWPTSLPHHRIP